MIAMNTIGRTLLRNQVCQIQFPGCINLFGKRAFRKIK